MYHVSEGCGFPLTTTLKMTPSPSMASVSVGNSSMVGSVVQKHFEAFRKGPLIFQRETSTLHAADKGCLT